MSEQLESDAHAGGHGTTAVIAALLANLGIVAAKFIGFLLTGAASILAEAFHSVAWWSFIRTTKKPELAVVLLEDIAAEFGLRRAVGGAEQ